MIESIPKHSFPFYDAIEFSFLKRKPAPPKHNKKLNSASEPSGETLLAESLAFSQSLRLTETNFSIPTEVNDGCSFSFAQLPCMRSVHSQLLACPSVQSKWHHHPSDRANWRPESLLTPTSSYLYPQIQPSNNSDNSLMDCRSPSISCTSAPLPCGTFVFTEE